MPPVPKYAKKKVEEPRPIVMAVLQNMYFNEPDRAKKILQMYEAREEPGTGRQRFIRDFLFFGCLTGRRLDAAFELLLGDQYRWMIVWEEASPEIGGHSSSVFDVNPFHVRNALELHAPRLLLLFGKVAASACVGPVLGYVKAHNVDVELAPHPAARGMLVQKQLIQTATLVREYFRLNKWTGFKEDNE